MLRFVITDPILLQKKISVFQRSLTNTPVHWHDCYEIEIFLRGSGTTVINSTTYPFHTGSIFFIAPGDCHSYKVDEFSSVLNLSFLSNAIEYSGILEMLYPLSYMVLDVEKVRLDRISTYVLQLAEEIETDQFFSKKYISYLMSCILIELQRENEKNNLMIDGIDSSLPIRKAIYYVRTHFKEEISLETVAKFVNIPYSTLSKQFAKHVGVPFKEYLNNIRLEYSLNLITHSSETITDIAYYCGFNSLSYFQRVFSKKYHMTPLAYRKLHAETERN